MESVFHHVGIYCRDIEESIAFYEDVLGCRLLFESDAQEGDKPLKMAWLKRGDLVFELLECEDKATCEAAGSCLNDVALRVVIWMASSRIWPSGALPSRRARSTRPWSSTVLWQAATPETFSPSAAMPGRSCGSCSSAAAEGSASKPSRTT